jgi:hypothetical protein
LKYSNTNSLSNSKLIHWNGKIFIYRQFIRKEYHMKPNQPIQLTGDKHEVYLYWVDLLKTSYCHTCFNTFIAWTDCVCWSDKCCVT